MLHPTTAVVDCKYDIQNPDSTMRQMWSTFILVAEKKVVEDHGDQEYVAGKSINNINREVD